MSRFVTLAVCGVLAAAPAAAQGPAPMPGRAPMGPPPMMMGQATIEGAEFLLAHTGELHLGDAQVTRLAAIARRAADRRQAERTAMESRAQALPPGTTPSADDRRRMMQSFQQAREQSHADLRDAVVVLTPDQQALAWEMVAGMRGFAGPPRERMRQPFAPRPGRAPGAPADGRDGAPPPPPRPQG